MRTIPKLQSTFVYLFCLAAPLAACGQASLTNGLVAFYPFTGNANDKIGTNDGTPVGATLTFDRFGNANSAYSFNGTNAYIVCPDTGFPAGNTPRTVSAWLRVSTFGTPATIAYPFSYGADGATDAFYTTVDAVNSGGPYITVGKSGGGDAPRWQSPQLDVWYQVVVSYDGAAATLFVNGTNRTQASRSYSTTLSGNFYIGRYLGGFPPTFYGAIDDVRIYSRALSEAEVQQLYTAEAPPASGLWYGLVAYFPFNGNASDEAGNGYDGTVNGATLTSDRFNIPKSAYAFNGVSDYIRVNKTLPDTTNLTISAWVQYASGSYENGQGTIFDDSDTAASSDFEFGMRDASHAIIVATKAGSSLTQNAALGRNISNEWAQLSWVVSGTGSTVYLDGAPVYSTAQAGNNTVLHALPVIGATASENPFVAFFGGKIDDLRVYNRALSPSEIQQLYQSESGPEVALIKAVKPSFTHLVLGVNYQLQVSADLNTWTNYGVAFTAASNSMIYPQYWDVDNWNSLYFRLQTAP